MKLILFALRKPITILVVVAALFFFGLRALNTIKIDIFPKLDLPVLYIAHPYGGFTPTQMETFFAKQYINVLLYVNGIKSIETKNVQGLTLIKLNFYPGTNMAQAVAEVSAVSNRAQALFPQGSNPPFDRDDPDAHRDAGQPAKRVGGSDHRYFPDAGRQFPIL